MVSTLVSKRRLAALFTFLSLAIHVNAKAAVASLPPTNTAPSVKLSGTIKGIYGWPTRSGYLNIRQANGVYVQVYFCDLERGQNCPTIDTSPLVVGAEITVGATKVDKKYTLDAILLVGPIGIGAPLPVIGTIHAITHAPGAKHQYMFVTFDPTQSQRIHQSSVFIQICDLSNTDSGCPQVDPDLWEGMQVEVSGYGLANVYIWDTNVVVRKPGVVRLSFNASPFVFPNGQRSAIATLTNSGNLPVALLGSALAGEKEFGISNQSTCLNRPQLMAGENCNYVINFQPSHAGTFSDLLTVRYSAPPPAGGGPLQSEIQLPISATGISNNVSFQILPDTGSDDWNTPQNPLYIAPGTVLMITNLDSEPHMAPPELCGPGFFLPRFMTTPLACFTGMAPQSGFLIDRLTGGRIFVRPI